MDTSREFQLQNAHISKNIAKYIKLNFCRFWQIIIYE